ncbi:MAG: cell wall hydrolase [Alphaproteobacteria bacterium]|nr:cell wall hydrolase [Alphaproteobacteria bacterium]
MTNDQTDYLARTIWGEARGEGARGMQAVGNVIMNRVKAGGWYGASIKDVVLKPYQFSAWNVGDLNRAKMLNATPAQLSTARKIAEQLQSGALPDITGGATNYHATGISPLWAKKMTKTVQIGNHIFYKE